MSEHEAQKPFFLYIAFGATHAPVQVPKKYTDKYAKTFEKGWDQIREDRYRRQLKLGVIPAETQLPPRNPGDPAWTSLNDEERAVHSRFMAAYAGFSRAHRRTDWPRGAAPQRQRTLREHRDFSNVR